ncbi:hypothetical protein AB4084_37085, partial [Lysobacter sp. 2RAB21]
PTPRENSSRARWADLDAARIEELMTRQGELYDALDAEIAELEEVAVSLQPVSDEAAGTVH